MNNSNDSFKSVIFRYPKPKEFWIIIPKIKIPVWRNSKQERYLVSALLVLVFVGGFFHGELIKEHRLRMAEAEKRVYLPNPFKDVVLQASSAFVFDITQGKLVYGLHEERPLPIASITKIMTALIALDIMDEEETVVITQEAFEQEADNGLYINEKWKLEDLIKFMLITSSNDAAHAIALAGNRALYDGDAPLQGIDSFVARMNEKAGVVGMANTKFLNATGLDEGDMAGAYGSAKDVALLLSYAYEQRKDIFSATAQSNIVLLSLSGFSHNIQNTNTLLNENLYITSSKTGLTELAGGNLVVGYKNGGDSPLIISILGSSREGRFTDAKQLMSAAAVFSGK